LPASAVIAGFAELARWPGAAVHVNLKSVCQAEGRFEGDSLVRVPVDGLPPDAKKQRLRLVRCCHVAHEIITVERTGPIPAYRQLSFGLAHDKNDNR
jgi:hypothetical protein